MKDKMGVSKKVTITMHPIEIEKAKRIAKKNQETFSGMISRLIHDYKED